MASIRKIKKELALVTDSLLSICYIAEMSAEKNQLDEIDKITENSVKMHNDIVFKIQNYRDLAKEQNKPAPKYFKELRNEINDNVLSIIAQLKATDKPQ